MPMWPPEIPCRKKEMPSRPTEMPCLPNVRTWRNATMKKPPECAARPRGSATPLLRLITSLLVSHYSCRVLLPITLIFSLLLTFSFLPQRPGLLLRKPPMLLLPNPEKKPLLLEGLFDMNLIDGLGRNTSLQPKRAFPSSRALLFPSNLEF